MSEHQRNHIIQCWHQHRFGFLESRDPALAVVGAEHALEAESGRRRHVCSGYFRYRRQHLALAVVSPLCEVGERQLGFLLHVEMEYDRVRCGHNLVRFTFFYPDLIYVDLVL